MSELFLGADPGRTGGLVLLANDRTVLTCAFGSSTEQEISNLVKSYREHIKFAVVERVWGRLGDAPNHAGVLCQSYGFIRGILTAHEIPFTECTPQKWQARLGVPGDDKPALRQYMGQRYPAIRWTNGVSAAGCLAEYARLLRQGNGSGNRGDVRESGVSTEDGDGATAASETTKILREF